MSFESLGALLAENRVAVKPTIAATATVADALALMRQRDADAVVATNDDHFAGMLSAGDVARSLVGRDATTTRIADALSTESARVAIDATIAEAIAAMDARGCDHVAVADRDRVVGVLFRAELHVQRIRNEPEQLDRAIRAVKLMGMANRRGEARRFAHYASHAALCRG